MYDLWKQNRELCEKPECLRCTPRSTDRPSSGATQACSNASFAKVDLFLSPSQSTIEQHRRRGFLVSDAAPAVLPAARGGDRAASGRARRGPRPGRPYFLFVGSTREAQGRSDADRGVSPLRGRRPAARRRRDLRRRVETAGRGTGARALPRPRASGRVAGALRGSDRRRSFPRSSTRRSASSPWSRSRSGRR